MNDLESHQESVENSIAEPSYEVVPDEQSGYQPGSLWCTFKTRGGWEFDGPRREDPEKLSIYAEAIDEMVDTASQFEPQLEEKIPSRVAFPYFYGKMLEKAQEPKVREMLLRTVVDALARSGSAGDIVPLLSANHDLDLPELQNSKHIGSLLEAAQSQGDKSQEYWLVRRVAELERKGQLKTQLFKHDREVGTTPSEYKYQFGWQERELLLLERKSREVLAALAKTPEATIYDHQDLYWDLSSVNIDWQSQELFYGKERTPLALDVFTAIYKMLERSGSAGEYLVKKAAEWGVAIKKTTPNDEVSPAKLRRHLGRSFFSRFRRNDFRASA